MVFRIGARLDIKYPNLVKGIQFEGLRNLGDPNFRAQKYYSAGIDEICYQDIVASLYSREAIINLLKSTSKGIYVPITAGGGIRKVEDARSLLREGADRISLNTITFSEIDIIERIATETGLQAVVISIEAKKIDGEWYCMTESGRENSGIKVNDRLRALNKHSVGEINLSSVDRDGTAKGFDLDLLEIAQSSTSLPLMVHGGISNFDQILNIAKLGASGVLIASALHYERLNILETKYKLDRNGIEVRLP